MLSHLIKKVLSSGCKLFLKFIKLVTLILFVIDTLFSLYLLLIFLFFVSFGLSIQIHQQFLYLVHISIKGFYQPRRFFLFTTKSLYFAISLESYLLETVQTLYFAISKKDIFQSYSKLCTFRFHRKTFSRDSENCVPRDFVERLSAETSKLCTSRFHSLSRDSQNYVLRDIVERLC